MQAAGSTALVPTTDQIVVIQLHCSLFLLVSPSLGSLHDTQFILLLLRDRSACERAEQMPSRIERVRRLFGCRRIERSSEQKKEINRMSVLHGCNFSRMLLSRIFAGLCRAHGTMAERSRAPSEGDWIHFFPCHRSRPIFAAQAWKFGS